MAKKGSSVRLTEDAWKLLDLLSTKLGVSTGSVMELAVREKAQREGVALPPATGKQTAVAAKE